jgi:dihydroflavonol-4-reductase
MSRCFVTGGNGFMGARIVRALLARGYRVIAGVGSDLDLRNLEGLDVEVRPLELLDADGVRRALEGAELLVHAAAMYSFWQPDRAQIYRVNVEGTRNVLRAAAAHGVRRLVHTSSLATLTPSIEGGVESEENLFDLRRFHGHYKSSKVLSEQLVWRALAQGQQGVIVHPTTVLGPGDQRPTPTGGILVHFLNGRMKAFADTVLNLVDVDDVAEGHVLALEHGRQGGHYILGGENLTLREVTRILSELTGIPAPRVAIPPRLLLAAGRANEWIADHLTHRTPLVDVESTLHAIGNRPASSQLAQKELGYRPRSARVALTRAAAWFLENGYASARYARRIRAFDAARGGVLVAGERECAAGERECALPPGT